MAMANPTPGAAFGCRDSAADKWEAKKSRALERRGRLGKATSNAILGGIGGILQGDDATSAPPKLGRKALDPHKSSFAFGAGDDAPARPVARAYSMEPACWQDQQAARVSQPPAHRSGSRPPSGKPPSGRPSPSGKPPTGTPSPAAAPKSYADELAQQVEEKRARKASERAANISSERTDDARVGREAGELQRDLGREVNKQRQRERAVSENADSLSRFLAEQSGPKGGRPPAVPMSPAQAAAKALDAARQAVPGLCPAASSSVQVAGGRSQSEGPRGRAHHGTPQKSSLDFGEPVQRTSANAYASGANQNCGNGITDKPTSRVLRPPGGGGSLQLGWGG